MTAARSHSAFAPFRHRAFLVLWMATLVSNIGTWMFNVTSGWLMTELSDSALMVSLVQAATALPIFLLALPAGAFGDIFDRRKLLLVTQLLAAAVMGSFAFILLIGAETAWNLLIFTFATGAVTAFAMPAWQAIVPRLVPREILPAAVTMNGVSVNAARAIGPALGGVVLVAVGAVVTVSANALSYLAIVAALLWWKSAAPNVNTLPRERLVGAMQAGLRFALLSEPLRDTLVRVAVFLTFASAYWALLPLIARDVLRGGPGLYGTLLAGLGVGAVMGSFALSFLRQKRGVNRLMTLATIGTSLTMLLFAYGGNQTLGIMAAWLGGLCWIMAMSSLNLSSQVALPEWVRARGMAIYQMVLFGAMAAGSLLWGQVASLAGTSVSLAIAAATGLLSIPLTRRYRLNRGEHHDHTPSKHWPEPAPVIPIANDHGPVLVTLEYFIADEDRQRFTELMEELGRIRRRDGAIQWGYFEDVEKNGRFIEMFTAESWIAHLRQHERTSVSDKILQDQIYALHQGVSRPEVTHAVMPRKGRSAQKPPKYVD